MHVLPLKNLRRPNIYENASRSVTKFVVASIVARVSVSDDSALFAKYRMHSRSIKIITENQYPLS